MSTNVLCGLEPQSVFSYFEQLTRIPRGSGNEKAVSDYIIAYAEQHGYRWERDEANNVKLYGFNMHPDCAQLATQAVVWEFVCGYRSSVYPYTLYDTTCANLFHYTGDDVAVAYNIIIDRIMNHGKIPSFAVKYRNQLSDANAITLTWDGSKYTGTATDTNGVLPQYYFSTRCH